MEIKTRISIAIPIYDTPKTAFFLARLFKSLSEQTFTNYEIVVTNGSPMAKNHNSSILNSHGELIKIMQMDDYFAHPEALETIVDTFKDEDQWMISSCIHQLDDGPRFGPHYPKWSDDMITGNNTLGGVSTITLRNNNPMLFDEKLSWLVDCDLYQRYYEKFGPPIYNQDIGIVIDTRKDRLTGTLADELKRWEGNYLMKKYAR